MSPGLYCIELRTAQWETLVHWYRTALGLRVLVRVVEDGYALLEAGQTRLAILARESPPPASGRWSLAFEIDNIEVASARLAAAGATFSAPTISDEGLRDVQTTDPDGNRIRLFCWPEARSAKS
jgi:predicted enzyme related to lactoylglutathione lyase